MKILLAEDDFSSRKLLHKAMQAFGECDSACNGTEAWEAFRTGLEEGSPYSLVLLDIMMPGMDGGEVLRRIRELEEARGIGGLERCRIVMATSFSDKENVLGSFNAQCDGYVRKPYTPDSLREDLRRQGILPAGMARGEA